MTKPKTIRVWVVVNKDGEIEKIRDFEFVYYPMFTSWASAGVYVKKQLQGGKVEERLIIKE